MQRISFQKGLPWILPLRQQMGSTPLQIHASHQGFLDTHIKGEERSQCHNCRDDIKPGPVFNIHLSDGFLLNLDFHCGFPDAAKIRACAALEG